MNTLVPEGNDLKKFLADLDIPVENDWVKQTVESGKAPRWQDAPIYITHEVANRIWSEWYPNRSDHLQDPLFMRRFRSFLRQGVSLGCKLERFREVSGRLPIPANTKDHWLTLFEEAISDHELGYTRLFFNQEDYQYLLESDTLDEKEDKTWKEMVKMLGDGLFYETGIFYPAIQIQVDETLESSYFRFEWNDFQLPPIKGLERVKVLVNDTTDRLTLLNIKGEEAINPVNGNECAIIDGAFADICEQSGLTTWDWKGYIILSLSSQIRKASAALVNRDYISFYLGKVEQAFPTLVAEINKKFEFAFLVQIFRGLLNEEISVRNSHELLGALLSLQSTIEIDASKYIAFDPITKGTYLSSKRVEELDPQDYVEFARQQLKRFISRKYTRGGNTLVVYLLDPAIENFLEARKKLALPVLPKELETLLAAIRNEIGVLPPTAQYPIILTYGEIRSFLKKYISNEFPHLAVLAYGELSPDMNIQPLARIYWEDRQEEISASRLLLAELLPLALRKATLVENKGEAKQAHASPSFWDSFFQKERYPIIKKAKDIFWGEFFGQLDLYSREAIDEYLNLLLVEMEEWIDKKQFDKLTDIFVSLSMLTQEKEIQLGELLQFPQSLVDAIRDILLEKYLEFADAESASNTQVALEVIDELSFQLASIQLGTIR